MIAAAADLLGERGLAGTSFSEVTERSAAPRGSIYHHFPQGKDELMAASVVLVGDRMSALFAHRAGETPPQAVRRIVDAWREVMVATECKAGCAIAAVTNERASHPALARRAAKVFVTWERQLGKTLAAAGLPRARAAEAAALMLAALEGALILCRARGGVQPLEAVREALTTFVER